jgi:pyridoxine 5-phosphate synthase
MATLAVNVDHIATLRQARGVDYPDPVAAAVLAELAGADGIVVHLREDRRHIQDRDVRLLRETVQTKLILEMAATPGMIDIAVGIKPDLVTLVPEKREELTTEGGLDLLANRDHVADAVARLRQAGIPTSIFIDPDPEQVKAADRIDAEKIEIHTGTFCDAASPELKDRAFAAIADAAKLAARLNLGVNAGHGLCYNTIQTFRGLSEIDEFSIGHSIVSRAALVGMDRAVRDMVTLVGSL